MIISGIHASNYCLVIYSVTAKKCGYLSFYYIGLGIEGAALPDFFIFLINFSIENVGKSVLMRIQIKCLTK